MKKIISIITIFVLCLSIFGIRTSAEVYRSELSERDAAIYINKNKNNIEKYIKKIISETDYYLTDNIFGEIKISYPFSYSLVDQKANKIWEGNSDVKWSAVIYNDNVIGLLNLFGSSYKNIYSYSYIPVSENAFRNINNGVSFYLEAYHECYMFITPEEEVSLAYFYDSILLDKNLRIRNLNLLTGKSPAPSFKQASKYNFINADTEIIHSFEYTSDGEKNITDGDSFYISCTDRYLTYSDGKFLLSGYSGSENQKFILTRHESGCYSIAPEAAPDRKIKVGGTGEFKLNLSYLNGYCYSINKPGDSGLAMTAKGSGIVFAKYHSSKYNLSDQRWIIERAEKT